MMAAGKRPVPFRTRKLSPPAPMVLLPGGSGRVGYRRPNNFTHKGTRKHTPVPAGAFSLYARCLRDPALRTTTTPPPNTGTAYGVYESTPPPHSGGMHLGTRGPLVESCTTSPARYPERGCEVERPGTSTHPQHSTGVTAEFYNTTNRKRQPGSWCGEKRSGATTGLANRRKGGSRGAGPSGGR